LLINTILPELHLVGLLNIIEQNIKSSTVKTLANISIKGILLELGKLWEYPDRRGNLWREIRHR